MRSNLIDGNAILEGLNWRYATKQYDRKKKISVEDWATLEEAMSLAPSSFGIQPYKFIVINDDATREQLNLAAYGQTPVTEASHLVAFAYKRTLTDADIEHFVDRISEVRGASRESLSDYENVMKTSVKKAIDGGYIETWNSRQAYIAIGFLLETAALLSLDATPMEGFDVAKVNEILSLTDYSVVALAAVGYRDAEHDWLEPLKKVRKPNDEIIERI